MKRMTQIREAQGASKAAVARAAGLDQSLISKVESGRVIPYDSEIIRIAVALGVPEREARSLLQEVTP